MLAVRNIAETKRVWGGVIFLPGQTRADVPRADLNGDANFFRAILANEAQIIVDGSIISDAILAVDAVRAEPKKDEQGALYARLREAPEGWEHATRSLGFVTGDVGSLRQHVWPTIASTDAVISLHRIEDGALVPADAATATITGVVWAPKLRTMPKSVSISTDEAMLGVEVYVGIQGAENVPQGRLFERISFALDTTWFSGLVEPKPLAAPIILLVWHPVGAARRFEVELEYFTNFEVQS